MIVGESDSFTISASNLDTSRNYTIRLTTSDSDAGFNSSCSDRSDTIDVPANSISYTSSHTVYACDEDSADLEAQLRIGTTTEDDASSRISISAPTVSISGLETTLTVGESDSFRVQASGLSASLSYNIRIDAESGLAFNSACTDRRYDYTVPSNSSSATVSPTVYACSVGNHSLQFKIRRGTVIDSQASETLAVYRCRNTTVVSDYASNPLLVADCETLLELKDALAGTATLNWGTDSAITSWDGVTLGGTPTRVVRIDLVDKSLTGSIPPQLGDISALQVLDLRRNSLTGSIPPQLGGITSLQSLQLSKNLLDGDIPSELAGLTSLIRLGINDNSFTGSIPSFFGDYENLEHLWLKGNSFTGPIPSSLGDLDSLNELNIAPNSGLTGCVPVGLRDVETNDTADLGLPYCEEMLPSPDPPNRIIANGYSPDDENGNPDPKLKIEWTAVDDATAYRLEYREECYIHGPDSEPPHTIPCGGSERQWIRTEPEELPVTDQSRTTFAYVITDLSLGRTYELRVRTVSGESMSDWSEPAIGYVSDTRPGSAFTFSLFLNWNPPQDNSAPVYRYVMCNPVGTMNTAAENDNSLPTITSERAEKIRNGIARWEDLTKWNGFWKNGDEFLIKVEEDTDLTCGVDGDPTQNNTSVSEVKVVGEDILNDMCGKGNMACVNAYEFVIAAEAGTSNRNVLSVTSADIYISSNRSGGTDECNAYTYISIHEAGHALAIHGSDHSSRYHHSTVRPSIMRSWNIPYYSICDPSYYDIAALIAAYQGRFSIDSDE